MPITNRLRKTLNAAASHHSRRKNDQFIAEGSRCCYEAVSRRPEWIEALFFSRSFVGTIESSAIQSKAEANNITIEEIDDKELQSLADTPNPQGVLAIIKKPQVAPPEKIVDPFVLILDRISEPGNMGTILRTAWAVGLTQVWLVKGSADPFAPKVVRAGMGAQFALSFVSFDSLAEAKETLFALGGKRLWCTEETADVSVFDEERFILQESGLVIGNEANGISDTALGTPVTIPMPGNAE